MSPVPFVTGEGLKPGSPERLSTRITRLIAENPGPFTYTGTGTYLLNARNATVVVDPGPLLDPHLERICEAAASPIAAILITHTHRDHCGGADRLKSITGAPVMAFGPHPHTPGDAAPALDEGADHGFRPDRLLEDGERLGWEDLTIEAVHTPGHISNHLCFALEEEDALFTGDHIMGWATTVVAPPDGNMTEYLASLDLLLSRRDRIYYPTHGAPIDRPRPFVEAVRHHRQQRDAAIRAAIADAPRRIEEIVAEVYEGLNPALRVAAGLNVKAHLDMHLRSGTVRETETGKYVLIGG